MDNIKAFVKNSINKDYTALSYAISIHNDLVVSDAIGVIDKKNNELVTEDCTFNVASISKIYVTVAIMQLVEQGKIKLDDYVADLLPRFYMPDERYKKITVEMCLNHTSGLPGTEWKHFSTKEIDGVDYYDEVYHYFSVNKLKADPGEYAVYCNDGFTVAELIVSEVSGLTYEEYVKKYITEPIGAYSTRLSGSLNPNYPLVTEGDKPRELLLVRGAAGITTSMKDLVKFGQLFLNKNSIISEESKELMARKWGKTFLKEDERSDDFGLGWDTVCLHVPHYDLGEHVLVKGGNSFYFYSRLIIIPKYDAVLAISATHDTKIDVQDLILHIFANYMLEKGINITDYQVPGDENNSGIYASAFEVAKVSINGYTLFLHSLDEEKKWSLVDKAEYLNEFTNIKNEVYSFAKDNIDTYLMKKVQGKNTPQYMKIENHPQLTDVWKNRVGKTYIVCDATPYDIVIGQMLMAITVEVVEEVSGVVALFGHYRKGGFSDNGMRQILVPSSDSILDSTLRTPSNGSRDLIHAIFSEKDGKEYLEAASYNYVDANSLEEFNHQTFNDDYKNQVYHFEQLEKMIEIPFPHRVLVLDNEFNLYYDSLDEKEYKPISTSGYIVLI